MNHMPVKRGRGQGVSGAARDALALVRALSLSPRRTEHSERDAPQKAEIAELGRERLGRLHRDRA